MSINGLGYQPSYKGPIIADKAVAQAISNLSAGKTPFTGIGLFASVGERVVDNLLPARTSPLSNLLLNNLSRDSFLNQILTQGKQFLEGLSSYNNHRISSYYTKPFPLADLYSANLQEQLAAWIKHYDAQIQNREDINNGLNFALSASGGSESVPLFSDLQLGGETKSNINNCDNSSANHVPLYQANQNPQLNRDAIYQQSPTQNKYYPESTKQSGLEKRKKNKENESPKNGVLHKLLSFLARLTAAGRSSN
ncbi:MAG: hypothetical protein IT292_03390 [Deltaproteobacteria bacterium]|nr:hypothetical protein [Deltaproteobacteria bacterium]